MYIPRAEYPNAEKKIIIFTGAGLSAPSGVSTFSGEKGIWNNHKIEDICDENTWKKNFIMVHDFYNDIRTSLGEKEPSEGHKGIVRIVEKYGKENVYVITQNIDNLLERAGVTPLHVHGELTKMECEDCGQNWNIGYNKFDIEKDKCPNCGSLKGVRPKIVFYNGAASMYSYMKRAFEHSTNKDTIAVIIGTSGSVVSIDYNLKSSCKKILCNMEPSPNIDVEKIKFDKVYYESIETGIHKIEKDIEEWWTI